MTAARVLYAAGAIAGGYHWGHGTWYVGALAGFAVAVLVVSAFRGSK